MGMALDPYSDIPLYQQLAELLMSQIDGGELAERRAVPSKKTLMQEYDVAGGTVDRAMDVLRAAGRIRTVLGRGLYVTPRSEWPKAGNAEGPAS
jgi:GntR family transcriptional regulator